MKRVPPQSLTWRELIADPDADPPAWLLDAIRAIEADS